MKSYPLQPLTQYFTIALLLVGTTLPALAQRSDPRRDADRYFDAGRYDRALILYQQYGRNKKHADEARLLQAKCYYYMGQPTQALNLLKIAIAGKSPDPECYLYIAKSKHRLHRFQEAAQAYKEYLSVAKPVEPTRQRIKDEITRSLLGERLLYAEKSNQILEPAGDSLNSPGDELRPLWNPARPNYLYFSSARNGNWGGALLPNGTPNNDLGRHHSDIFYSELQSDWTPPRRLDLIANSRFDDLLLDFSPSGQNAIIWRNNPSYPKGRLYMWRIFPSDDDTLAIIPPEPLPEPINQNNCWTGDIHLFNDTVMIFSSDRPGGFGGRDLYITFRDTSGNWRPPLNLGNKINTPFDEVSPFLAKDGRTLYFSSNSLNSIGGFDIFRARFSDSSVTWQAPHNLGLPINSADDDLHYRIAADGSRAYFSSNRPDGAGGFDLYYIFFRKFAAEQILYSNPLLFTQVVPRSQQSSTIAEQEGIPTELEEGTLSGSNIASGKRISTYRFAPILYDSDNGEINPGSKKIVAEIAKLLTEFPQATALLTVHTDNVGAETNNLYLSIKQAEQVRKQLLAAGVSNHQIHLRGCGSRYPTIRYEDDQGQAIPFARLLNRRIEVSFYNLRKAPVQIIYDQPTVPENAVAPAASSYQQRLRGLSYKVQVRTTRNIWADKILSEYPDPHTEVEPDNSAIHYTMGLYPSFVEARQLMDMLQAKGHKEARVIAYYNGLRVSNEQANRLLNDAPDIGYYLDFYSIRTLTTPDTAYTPQPDSSQFDNQPAPSPSFDNEAPYTPQPPAPKASSKATHQDKTSTPRTSSKAVKPNKKSTPSTPPSKSKPTTRPPSPTRSARKQ